MYNLPPVGSELDELGGRDIEHVITRGRLPPAFHSSKIRAREFFAKNPEAHSLHAICVRADGDMVLARFGKKGGHKIVWNYGRWRPIQLQTTEPKDTIMGRSTTHKSAIKEVKRHV